MYSFVNGGGREVDGLALDRRGCKRGGGSCALVGRARVKVVLLLRVLVYLERSLPELPECAEDIDAAYMLRSEGIGGARGRPMLCCWGGAIPRTSVAAACRKL